MGLLELQHHALVQHKAPAPCCCSRLVSPRCRTYRLNKAFHPSLPPHKRTKASVPLLQISQRLFRLFSQTKGRQSLSRGKSNSFSASRSRIPVWSRIPAQGNGRLLQPTCVDANGGTRAISGPFKRRASANTRRVELALGGHRHVDFPSALRSLCSDRDLPMLCVACSGRGRDGSMRTGRQCVCRTDRSCSCLREKRTIGR